MAEDVLTCLPDEVLELILVSADLSIRDVVNVALTCKHLHRVVFVSNILWRTKFFQRWPLLRDVYVDYEKHTPIRSWLQEVQNSINARRTLIHHVSQMSAKFYKKQELSTLEFADFDPLFQTEMGAHPLAYHILIDELIRLIEIPAAESNLTHKYYVYKVVRYMKQCYLTNEWDEFIKLPPKQQLLEKAATIVSQWSQPEKHVTYKYICGLLDDIVERAKEVLKEKHPSHSLFSTPPEVFEEWKNNNIDDNQWSVIETKQVISALGEVMFNILGYNGNNEMYYCSENSFIDCVLELKHGIPITLAIIFESICRRVGVKCEPISFPAHFLLRWKERYTGPDTDQVQNFYIDVFNGGQFLTKENCPRIAGASKCPVALNHMPQAATALQVVKRMATNLNVAERQCTRLNGRAARLRSALELRCMVRPHDTGDILQLARFYMLYQLDLGKLVSMLTFIRYNMAELRCATPANRLLRMLLHYEKHMNLVPEETIEVKRRNPRVKYGIGMIMRYVIYDCVCVITGWDLKCEASPEWMLEMGVQDLKDGANQPFYNVFANDGSSRYVAQVNLAITPPEWVNHYEIGRYFCQFKGTHYVPNEEKANEYPEDAEAVQNIIRTEYNL